MKKFTAILLFAVLALGCVFAASGDVVVLETKIDEVKPVFKMTGTAFRESKEATKNSDKSSATSSSDNLIFGTLSDTDDSVSLTISVKEFGYQESTAKDYIRWKGVAAVTVKTESLKNVKYIASSDSEMKEQGALSATAPTVTTTKGQVTGTIAGTSKTISSVTSVDTSTNGTVMFKVNHFGYKVSCASSTGIEVASWTWTWDTTNLIGGETYRTDVTITYTGV
jgi:hypothetical protein